MESLTRRLLQVGVGGALLFGVAVFYNSKKRRTPEQFLTPLFFFNDQSTQCYSRVDHKIDSCPLGHQCPLRHIRTLIRLVKKTQTSLDICLYNLSHPELLQAILNVLNEGKRVRCVVGMSNDREFVKQLRSQGAFVKELSYLPPAGNHQAVPVSDLLMHHKFVVIDSQILITGSMNWTSNSFSCHWDHILVFTDQVLVKQFIGEFEYLFSSSADDEKAYTIRPRANLPMQACFFRRKGNVCRPDANRKKTCEREDCMYSVYRSIMHKIMSASSSIDMCIQQFTLEDLSNSLVLAHENGVKVRIICEKFMARGTGSQIPYLMKEGIPMRIQTGDGTLHHKFVIVDGKTLLTGSLNWTMQSFFGNYENVLIICKEDIVSRFQSEFNKLWDTFPSLDRV